MSHRQRAYEARRGARAHETVSDSPISAAFQQLVDSGEVTEEALAPFTGALRQAMTPLLDQQSALAESVGRSLLASMPMFDMSSVVKPMLEQQAAVVEAVGASALASFSKIDTSSLMQPLLEQQSALAKTLSTSALATIAAVDTSSLMQPLLDQQSSLAKALSASFASIDMSPMMKPLRDQQSYLADALGASALATFARVDMSSVMKPLIDATSFPSIPGLESLGAELTSRADEWLGAFDDEVQREARRVAASIADDVGVPAADPVAPLLLAAMLIAIVVSWRIEIDLQAAAVGAIRSAVVTGRFAVEFAEQVDERLPNVQNLHLWLLLLVHALRSKRRSTGEHRCDE
ncbi:MAG: hypothetical protein ACRDZV_00505 [Acidimicrobiia bacterium]